MKVNPESLEISLSKHTEKRHVNQLSVPTQSNRALIDLILNLLDTMYVSGKRDVRRSKRNIK